MGMAQLERPPLGAIKGTPALDVNLEQIRPAERLLRPTQRFRHRSPHRDDNRGHHDRFAGRTQRSGVTRAGLPSLVENRDVCA